MRFSTRKRRQPPAIIIISLIDILIVILIFLMVTTTFKQQPALKLALPESKQGKQQQGATENNLIITVDKQEPYLYLGKIPITAERLQTELLTRAASNPQLNLSIRADTAAPFGQIITVMDIAKAANVKSVFAFIKTPGQP